LAIQCALLHDVIEDTETKADEIENGFGQEVLKDILALTKNEELKKKKEWRIE
jgi:(p)ppGpp synthase/HD superfamily hydrolase